MTTSVLHNAGGLEKQDTDAYNVPIPPSPRLVFAQNVLKDVLCQLRFPPILAIAASEPAAYQEIVRNEYPLYSKDVAPELPAEVGGILSRFGVPSPPQHVRHTFASADGTRSIFLTQDFITVQRTAYTRWDEFGREIAQVVAAFVGVYRPAFFTRIGLRYRNEIHRENVPGMASAPWDRFVRPELAGPLMSPQLQNDIIVHSAKTTLQFEQVPSAMIQMDYGLRRTTSTVATFYMEADFYLKARTEIQNANGILDEFHTGAGNLFRWAISSELSAALGPTPAD